MLKKDAAPSAYLPSASSFKLLVPSALFLFYPLLLSFLSLTSHFRFSDTIDPLDIRATLHHGVSVQCFLILMALLRGLQGCLVVFGEESFFVRPSQVLLWPMPCFPQGVPTPMVREPKVRTKPSAEGKGHKGTKNLLQGGQYFPPGLVANHGSWDVSFPRRCFGQICAQFVAFSQLRNVRRMCAECCPPLLSWCVLIWAGARLFSLGVSLPSQKSHFNTPTPTQPNQHQKPLWSLLLGCSTL